MHLCMQVYAWLNGNCQQPKKTFEEREGRGTYLRVFHWAEYKAIPPLSSLAEIKTLKDELGKPVTQQGHLWIECKQPGSIKCREYACLTCESCSRLLFQQCKLGIHRVGVLHTCAIKTDSGALVVDRETGRMGLERAQTAVCGALIGAECANKTEPYIVCSVLEPLKIWVGPPGHSWMGQIREGDNFLKCQKYQRRTDTVYMEAAGSNSTFFLIADDVRIVFEQHVKQQRVERSRRGGTQSAPQPTTFQLAESELETLKNRVYIHSRDSGT